MKKKQRTTLQELLVRGEREAHQTHLHGLRRAVQEEQVGVAPRDDCRTLATKFNFSGGEIDNIVRKVVMEEVLHGARPTLAEIEELCRHEKIGNGGKGNCIGFLA